MEARLRRSRHLRRPSLTEKYFGGRESGEISQHLSRSHGTTRVGSLESRAPDKEKRILKQHRAYVNPSYSYSNCTRSTYVYYDSIIICSQRHRHLLVHCSTVKTEPIDFASTADTGTPQLIMTRKRDSPTSSPGDGAIAQPASSWSLSSSPTMMSITITTIICRVVPLFCP